MPRFFGQIEISVNRDVKITGAVSQVNRHHAVVLFPGRAAPLTLNARGFAALFCTARFVNQRDGIIVRVITPDNLLKPAAHRLVVPTMEPEKLLERSWRHARLQGDGLDTLALQIADLSVHISAHVLAARRGFYAVVKLLEEAIEPAFEGRNLRKDLHSFYSHQLLPKGIGHNI